MELFTVEIVNPISQTASQFSLCDVNSPTMFRIILLVQFM